MAIASVVPPGAASGSAAAGGSCEGASGAIERADALARAAARLLGHDVVPIAHAAARLVDHEEWTGFGYARHDDFAVEWLGRSGRWLRQSAALGRALARWPQLADAIEGRDGGPRLGALAAAEIARVAGATGAPEAAVRAWIAVARRVTLRALRDAVATALAACDDTAPGRTRDPEGDLVHVAIALPVSVREAFEDVLALHRVVEGYEATVSSFVEALCAELGGGSGEPVPEDDLHAVTPGPTVAERERAAEVRAACMGQPWAVDPSGAEPDLCVLAPDDSPSAARGAWGLHRDDDTDAVLAFAARELAAARALVAGDGADASAGVAHRLLDLLRVEQCLHNVIGRMLALLGSHRAWRRLGFADAGHYAEQRLGMSRTMASDCARIARVAVQVPQLADDWAAALLRTSAARHVARVLDTALRTGPDTAGGVDPPDSIGALAAAWVGFAQSATVKRIRDEVDGALSAWRRFRAGVRAPSADDAWRRSLRDPRRVDATGLAVSVQAEIAAGTIVITDDLHLTLERDLACRFVAGLDRAGASRLHTFAATDPSQTRWLGLLEALASYATSWGLRGAARNRPCRCDAPGCTARGNIHEHHVTYRSRGGSEAVSNKVDLCAFHHLRGEHGGLLQVRGMAPDDLVYRLGPEDNAQWFRNERRVSAPDL